MLRSARHESLRRFFGQPMVVEHKRGANTIVAASQVAKAPADGYTLFMAWSPSLAVNPLVDKKLAYQPDEDFAAISMLAQAPLVMVVNQTVPASNLKELTAVIRNPEHSMAFLPQIKDATDAVINLSTGAALPIPWRNASPPPSASRPR